MRGLLILRWPLMVALAITMYACLVRLDAYVTKYGPLSSPAWARMLTTDVAAWAMPVRPFQKGWPPELKPYVGGDPVNYIQFAREMTGFYQPHVREPIFLALTRVFLWLLGGEDAAVSFASATGSVLAVLGTYLLGTMLMPRIAALAAALLVAVDYELITWAVDGWRDDVVMATVVWTAWASLRLRDNPSRLNAVLTGVCGAVACLTRITALLFVIPAVVWLLVDSPGALRRARIKAASLALAVLMLLVLPYLVSCAIDTGDPFIAVNYHTIYYRHADAMSTEGKVTAVEYITGKFSRHPIRTLDIGLTGVFVHPFLNKWGGLQPMLGGTYRAVVWSSVAGLLMLPSTAAGRLLLVMLFSSLVPYAFTWNIGDGGAWRFTMHAYPLYILAACYAIARVWQLTVTLFRARGKLPAPSRRLVMVGAAVVLLAIAVTYAYATLPWFVVSEAIASGEDVNLDTGGRDRVFYTNGWSPPHHENIIVRVSDGERSVVRMPLPSVGAYEIALRLDPVLPDMEQRVDVLFNRHLVARFPLTLAPERIGSYRFRVQPHQVRAGSNELVLVPTTRIPASSAGPRFSWLPPQAQIGVRLWYVRILSLTR